MARSLNKAILIGNLGADPEVRTTTSGARVAQLSIATGRQWVDAQGATQERTEWHRVVVWEKLVDVVEQYLKKGDRVYVEGEIQYRTYEDAEGVTRYVTEIRGRELMMLGGRDSSEPQEKAAEPPAEGKKGGVGARRAQRKPATVAAAADDGDLPF